MNRTRAALLIAAAVAVCVAVAVWVGSAEPRANWSASDQRTSRPVAETVGVPMVASAAMDRQLVDSEPLRADFEHSSTTSTIPSGFSTKDEIYVWEQECGGMSRADMLEQSQKMFRELAEASDTPLRELVAAGIYEVVGEGKKMTLTKNPHKTGPEYVYSDGIEICRYMIPGANDPDRRQRKYTLPPDQFPELYAKKRHAMWLREKGKNTPDK